MRREEATEEEAASRTSRRFFGGLGKRERDKPTALATPMPTSAPMAAAGTGEALLILKSHEESGQGWFWATDAEGRLTYITDTVAGQLSPDPTSLTGQHFSEFFISAADGDDSRRTLPFALARKTKFSKVFVESAQGENSPCWEVCGVPHFDGKGEFSGFRGSGTDVTEQRRSSAQASQLAMYDALTGLSNRRRMLQTLVSTLRGFKQAERPCAVMLIDLDRFKHVNDTLGHPAGDALLKQVADRLLKIIGDRELVCRLGGDEFQVTLPDVSDQGVLGELASRIIGNLSQPYSVEGSRCVIGASIGIAVSPLDGEDSDALIRNADLALYAAKGSGRGRYRFFTTDFLRAAEDRRLLEEDLRDAVAREELKLHYQPVVCAQTNCVVGVEALCRWEHSVQGWVSPAVFIPIAEETNLIGEIGTWTLRRACEDAAGWPGNIRVAVNVSPIQFTDQKFPEIVTGALAASGLAPERLELELTEGIFLSDTALADEMFAALKDIGVRLALDDFGTGYSSLGYLRKAPFDKIKIDQSFVRGVLDQGARNAAIIGAIVALADALGMDTTAEGLESLDQLRLMRDLKVSHVQGFIYSKAVSESVLRERFETGEWIIAPQGPARQRHERQSVFRKAGVIHGDHNYPIIVRNMSASGALIQGLVGVPVGTQFVMDLGDGQFVVCAVRRSENDLQGVEFEQHLVQDGNGSFCTRHRVSSYLLKMAGLKSVHDSDVPLAGSKSAGLPAFVAVKDWRSASDAKKLAA